MLNDFLDNYYIILDKFKKSTGSIFRSLHLRLYLTVSVLINILSWIGARYIVSMAGEDQIALHYNVDAGIDYYGQAFGIYAMPLVALIILAANFLIFWFFSRKKDREFISHILLSNALVSNIIILTALYVIYLVNFR